MVFCGLTFAIWIAVSRIAALPEPLSLIPGPASTESRCAPDMTTLSSFLPFFSASTLLVGRVWRSVLAKTRIVSPGVPASAAPSA